MGIICGQFHDWPNDLDLEFILLPNAEFAHCSDDATVHNKYVVYIAFHDFNFTLSD